jgi:hypothetical protein
MVSIAKQLYPRVHNLTCLADDLKDVIQHLFEIQSAVHGYLGPETQQELVRKMYEVSNGTLYPFFIHLSLSEQMTLGSSHHNPLQTTRS